MAKRPHSLSGRSIDVKRAVSREVSTLLLFNIAISRYHPSSVTLEIWIQY